MENKTNKLLKVIVAVIVIAALISVVVYYFLLPRPGSVDKFYPNLICSHDDIEDIITVVIVDDDLLWSEIQIIGNCNTSGLGTYVKIDDEITNCSGTIIIIYIPTNMLIDEWNFT